MTFQKVLEMTMEPPFRYYIAKDNYLSTGVDDKFCFKSLSEAKRNAEKLFLQTKEKYSIYNVRYAGDDWSTKREWYLVNCACHCLYDSLNITNGDIKERQPDIYNENEKDMKTLDKIMAKIQEKQ